jgi:Tat protein translocase TatB subunit
MFGLGVWEIALILAVALIVLGPRKLPGAAKQLGRSLREFRRAASEFQVSLEQEADEQERRELKAARQAAHEAALQESHADAANPAHEQGNGDSDSAKVSPEEPQGSP